MCLSPLKRFQIGFHPSGKPFYLVRSRQVDFVYRVGSTWHDGFYGGAKIPYGVEVVRDGLITPCGQCIECRINHSRQWADRMMLELQYHESAFFVTLTYDQEHVPLGCFVDEDTGETSFSLSLYKPHLSQFIKTLRSRLDRAGKPPIRFFACGEYGDDTFRPHYHLIIFGLELDDLVYLKSNFRGEKYYTSQLLRESWANKGNVLVTSVSWETCAYVARYVTKKWTGELKHFYDDHGIEPEFCLMSRRPGIARQYFDEHADEIYKYDEIHISTSSGGKCVKPPRYYDCLYDREDPDLMAFIKERRQSDAEAHSQLVRRNCGYTEDELLEIQKKLYLKREQLLRRQNIPKED